MDRSNWVPRVKAHAMAMYERQYGWSVIIECFETRELVAMAAKFDKFDDFFGEVKKIADLQTESCLNAQDY